MVTKPCMRQSRIGLRYRLKWIKNGGSIEIELSDEHITWTYTTAEGVSVPYVDGYVVFPEEYLYPGIKDIDIGVFRGRRQDSISVDNYLTTRYNISLKQCSDYCVHHDIANGRIQLVQEKIHEQFCHVGGIYLFLKEGLLNADQTE